VRCTDQQGRLFIVEMQIQWTTSFMQRMLFNASKAYVTQLRKGEYYDLLRPVYGLGLINTQFDPDENDWYHHYKMVNVQKPKAAEIKDLQLVFIELPKFKAKNLPEKKLQILWLRFMSELNENTQHLPSEWLSVPEIKEAASLAEEAAYSSSELAAYDQYWDAISIEKTLVSDAHKEGREVGREEGREEGQKETSEKIALRLLKINIPDEEIAKITELSLDKIKQL